MKKTISFVLLFALLSVSSCTIAKPDDPTSEDDKKKETVTKITTYATENIGTGTDVTDVDETEKTDTDMEEPVDDSWKIKYAEFLNDNQESLGHACYYEKGNGRFALAYITDDSIPELYIVDESGQTMIYTCQNGEVRRLSFVYPTTDMRRFSNYSNIYYVEKGNDVMDKSSWKSDNGYQGYVMVDGAFVKNCEAYTVNGKYFFNEYDVERMIEDDFDYIYNYKDNEVTESVYDSLITRYGLDNQLYKNVTESDLYKIVPSVIDEVLK